MSRSLYITSSSYSGSTLLSFLLNTHPAIFTVGEMDGWNYGEDETFECSCGRPLADCPFFRRVAEAFAADDLPFDFRDFGTMYRLARSTRLNRYLTGSLPLGLQLGGLERARDTLLAGLPPFAGRLRTQDRANGTFIRTALQYSGARVFVDACKEPFRLRHLRRVPELELHVLHLVRDPRGVVLSNRELDKPGWSAANATEMWIRQQQRILRVTREFPNTLRVRYEDLCDRTLETLGGIHRFAGLESCATSDDFLSGEHHILGNRMRLSGVGEIRKNTKWQRELSAGELNEIRSTALAFAERRPDDELSGVIRDYLDET